MSQPEAGVSCAHCGAPIMGKQLRYCSPSCRNKAKGVRQYDPAKRQTRYLTKGFGTRTCDVCGETYTATYADQRTCGRLCGQIMRRTNMGQALEYVLPEGYLAKRLRKQQRVEIVKTCAQCGCVVPKGKHLCVDCLALLACERRRVYRSTPNGRAGHWQHKQMQRARRAGVACERVDPRVVYARDDWTCHVCGEPIDMDAPARTPRSATIDHVVPLSKGGAHSMENVRPAHFLCNCIKSDHIPQGVTDPKLSSAQRC
jgi:5-methylcytosine-specific restriction endonuclease McrA